MTPQSIILQLLLVISLVQTYGKNKADKISIIRQVCQKINSNGELRKKTINDIEEVLGHNTDGGGELVGYFDKNDVLKITLSVGLSYGIVTYDYYFNKGELIFVYENEGDFPINDSSGSMQYDKLKLSFEKRYYFNNNKIIKKIEKGKRRFSDSTEPDASQLLKDAKHYLNLIKVEGKFTILSHKCRNRVPLNDDMYKLERSSDSMERTSTIDIFKKTIL